MRTLLAFIISAVALGGQALCEPKITATVDASVTVRPDTTVRPLHGTLFGVNVHPAIDKPLMPKPEFIERVKSLGIRSCRFPNGCVADQYNWRSPAPNQASVDEFLDFCDAVGAEAYYTVNMQGGTEGLQGPTPDSASVDERIRYRHTAPNPCGNTDYTFGTLADALEFVRRYTIDRALSGKQPLLHYEMGNENWGQSRTDWPPEVYARTADAYARAMRSLLEDAKKGHAELSKLQLYIVAVGYPVMGNNMKLADTPDRDINVRWTRELNRLHAAGVIDAVQEHFYPYGSANGGTLAWAAHNLHNIIYARNGWTNDRLSGYRDPAIVYSMPMEHTEWNVKCWGSQFREDPQIRNPGFEDGLDGWTVSGSGARPVSWAARRGQKGLRVITGKDSTPCEVSQVLAVPEKAKVLVAGVWVRTDKPSAVKVQWRLPEGGQVLGEWGSRVAGTWERVIASANVPDGAEHVRLALLVEEPAMAYIDEVRMYSTSEERGQAPLSATTYEQELFCVDALREMALGGCPRAHLHHLSGNYPCGTLTQTGQTKDLAKSFQFFAGAYGDRVVETECEAPAFGYYSSGNAWATDFNALAPDRPDIPMLGCMASRRDDTLYLLLINRTSDRDIRVKVDLGAEPADGMATVRTLTGEDIDLPGAALRDEEISAARVMVRHVGPYSAQIVSVRIRR